MALPTLAVATPLGFRVWNPRDQVKVRVYHTSHSHVFCGYIGGVPRLRAARSPCINVSLGIAFAGTAATAAAATISRLLHPRQTFDVDFDVSFDVNAALHQTRLDVHFDVQLHLRRTPKYNKFTSNPHQSTSNIFGMRALSRR